MGVLTLPAAPQQEEYPLKEKVKKPQGMGESGSNLNENIMLDQWEEGNKGLYLFQMNSEFEQIASEGKKQEKEIHRLDSLVKKIMKSMGIIPTIGAYERIIQDTIDEIPYNDLMEQNELLKNIYDFLTESKDKKEHKKNMRRRDFSQRASMT